MPSSQSAMMSRPSLGHRSISEQAPLYNPSTNPHSGSHLRGSKAASGAQIATGSVLPHSPWLPLPPASNSKHSTLSVDVIDVEQTENFAPGQHRAPLGPPSLASRRQSRRGLSEGFSLHTNQHKSSRMAMAISAASSLGPKSALRLDIAPTADHFSAAASKSAGMIRGYSMPVATQEEHDEQQRIMALGLSPVGHYGANPAWWQYGWSSPGGVNHRHLQRQNGAPEFVSERKPSSQSKLATVMTPAMAAASTAAGPSPMSSSPVTTRPSSHASKTHSSCSPKMKNKHLPSIHQHTFQNTSSRSASSSPKTGRSPLSMISVNLPAVDQQQQEQALSKSVHDTISPINNAFDIEMDALSQRFEQWSRSQALSTLRESRSDDQLSVTANEDEDYFNLCHDEPQDNLVRGGADLGFLVQVTDGSDTSDEARTPRASSPRPLSKTVLQYHNLEHLATHKDDAQHSFAETNRWSANFDFIHPDHLA